MWNRWDLLRSFSYLFSEGGYRYMSLLHLSQRNRMCFYQNTMQSLFIQGWCSYTGIFPCAANVITDNPGHDLPLVDFFLVPYLIIDIPAFFTVFIN